MLYQDSNPLGWNVFGFYKFGQRVDENCAKFPKTVEIVEKLPGLQMAGFSALSPGCHITPHSGLAAALLGALWLSLDRILSRNP